MRPAPLLLAALVLAAGAVVGDARAQQAGAVPTIGAAPGLADGQTAVDDGLTPEGALSDPPQDTIPTEQTAETRIDAESLADLRAELAVVGRALQSLRAELVASGPAGFTAAGGTTAIERMDRMEADIARMTGQVEEMRNRVEATVAEAGNRAGDIEFRLCELDPTCELGALTATQPAMDDAGTGIDLGVPDAVIASPADGAVSPAGSGATTATDAVELAAYDRAQAAFAAGDNAGAAAQFAGFVAASPSSPLVPDAMFLRGEALSRAGDTAGASAAWLDAFTASPSGPRAGPALLNLAAAMTGAGQTADACRFYTDIPTRFPATPAATEAQARAAALACAPAMEAPAPATDPEEAADLIDGG